MKRNNFRFKRENVLMLTLLLWAGPNDGCRHGHHDGHLQHTHAVIITLTSRKHSKASYRRRG